MSGREFHHCNKVRKSQTTNPPRLFRSYLAWRTMEISEGRGGKKNTEELYVSGSEVKYITCLNFTGNIQGKKKKKSTPVKVSIKLLLNEFKYYKGFFFFFKKSNFLLCFEKIF